MPTKTPRKIPRSPNFERAALALAAGERPGAIAARLKIDRKTLWQWQQNPRFAEIYDEFLADQRQEIIGKMRAAGTKSIDLLIEAIADKNTPMKVRIDAARYILDRLGAGDIATFSPPHLSQDYQKMTDEELQKIAGIKP